MVAGGAQQSASQTLRCASHVETGSETRSPPNKSPSGTLDLTGALGPPAGSDSPKRLTVRTSRSYLNTGDHYSWALIRYPLTDPAIGGATFGLDTWVTLSGAPSYVPTMDSL
jgi:hypothetical protein